MDKNHFKNQLLITALHEFCRPSGICCDDDGRVIVADSKNQRVLIFSPLLEFLWAVSFFFQIHGFLWVSLIKMCFLNDIQVEIRPSSHNILTANMDEKDRPSDVSLLPGKFVKSVFWEIIFNIIFMYSIRWTLGCFSRNFTRFSWSMQST